MKRLALPMLAALALGALMVGAQVWRTSQPSESLVNLALEPVVYEPDTLDLRTGDTFWGLSLDGVIPCSSLLVKGGGHLVSLSRNSQTDRKLYFHIRDDKLIELDDLKFRLIVTGEDTVHVDRNYGGELAANVELGTE